VLPPYYAITLVWEYIILFCWANSLSALLYFSKYRISNKETKKYNVVSVLMKVQPTSLVINEIANGDKNF
jgi:hypothetical protein